MNEQAFAEVLLNPHFFHHFDVHKNENIPITDFDFKTSLSEKQASVSFDPCYPILAAKMAFLVLGIL